MFITPGSNAGRGAARTWRSRLSAWQLGWLAAAWSAASLSAEDWPHWRGPHFNGVSTETNYRVHWPAGGPKVLWRVPVGVGYSSVSVSRGRLYTMGNTKDVDAVRCVDVTSGKVLWKHAYPCVAKDPNGYHGTRATPTVDGGRVFTLSRRGHFFALDAATGRVLWAKNFPRDYGAPVPTWGFSGSPLVQGRMVITEVGGRGTSVVAFDKATGREIWRSGSDKVAYSSIVPFVQRGQPCLAVLSADSISGRLTATGREIWRAPWKTKYDVNAATPIVVGTRVFVSSGYGKGCALFDFSTRPPRAVWRNKNMRNHVGTCVFWQGHLYGFDERVLKCLEWATGRELWKERKYGKGSLLKAGAHWIVYSDKGYVAVADLTPAGCRELSGFQVLKGKDTWAAPVLSDGLLFCRNLDTVACVDLRP
jgi:outer membrane protein assembly factor BamB